MSYEKSVTDKENALINSFSNLIENNLVSSQQQQQQQIHENNHQNSLKSNGKLIDSFDPLSSDNDHQNDLIKMPISNGNGHPLISNLDNKM